MASIAKFDVWQNTAGVSYNPVIQCVTGFVNDMSTWAAPVGSSTIITSLNAVITPKYATSKIIVQWMINGECHHDMLFRVFKNNGLAPNGQNTGNTSRWNGFVAGVYDQDQNSTPANWMVQYIESPATTASITYQIAVGASGATAYTFALNRTIGSAGADSYENMVSSYIIWEIAQ